EKLFSDERKVNSRTERKVNSRTVFSSLVILSFILIAKLYRYVSCIVLSLILKSKLHLNSNVQFLRFTAACKYISLCKVSSTSVPIGLLMIRSLQSHLA
ncbi:hypothetical protein L9F63_027335, partial [Diploptera punctata]